MQFDTFESQIKDGLNNLFDFAALETHPLLASGIRIPDSFSGNKGEFLRKTLLEAIETLKPADKLYDVSLPEWRVYTVLNKRYVEGLTSPEVAHLLATSERQYRRYQKKAIQSVALILWNRFIQSNLSAPVRPFVEKPAELQDSDFSVSREQIALVDVIQGLIKLLAARMEEEGVATRMEEPEPGITVESDRVILRQILIELVNTLLNHKTRALTFVIHSFQGLPALTIRSTLPPSKDLALDGEDEAENNICFWAEKLGVEIRQALTPESGYIEVVLQFKQSDQKKILIIDDQEPAIRLFTRYLSRSNVRIIGLSKPGKVLARVKEVLPELIILDIMMPKMDGWEVLQSLKLDDETRHIPVIVCSAWGEPELAKSLGAIEFLRKPVTQRDLLATINSSGIFS